MRTREPELPSRSNRPDGMFARPFRVRQTVRSSGKSSSSKQQRTRSKKIDRVPTRFYKRSQKKGTDTSPLVPRCGLLRRSSLRLRRPGLCQSPSSRVDKGVDCEYTYSRDGGKDRFYPERRPCWKCRGQDVSGQFSGPVRPETNRGVKDDAMSVTPWASPLGDGARGGLCSRR